MGLERRDSAQILLRRLQTELFQARRVDVAVIEVANPPLVRVETIFAGIEIGQDGANLPLALDIEIEEGAGARPVWRDDSFLEPGSDHEAEKVVPRSRACIEGGEIDAPCTEDCLL